MMHDLHHVWFAASSRFGQLVVCPCDETHWLIATENFEELTNLRLYDIYMRRIATLVDEVRPAGLNEVLFDGTSCASGTIVFLLTTADGSSLIKMNLVK